METEDLVEDKEAIFSEDDKNMEDATQENNPENEEEGESKSAEIEEMNVENETIDKAAKEAKVNKALTAQRMADMRNNGGRRTTQSNDNMDKDEEISSEDIA